jgi:hypothetical protein
MEIQELPIHCADTRKQTGLETCWVVVVDNRVVENGPNHGLHPSEESAKESVK